MKTNLQRPRTLLNFLFKHQPSVPKFVTARIMTHLRLRLPIESGKAVNVDTDSVIEAEDGHISSDHYRPIFMFIGCDDDEFDYYIICSAKLVEIGWH